MTSTTLCLTKEFKELFMAAYQAGELPKSILESHGFDITIIGERRIWGISQHIREEYKKYGEFHEGHGPRPSVSRPPVKPDPPASEKDELKQLRNEVDYLKQEIEFFKKNFFDQNYKEVGALLMNASSFVFEIIHIPSSRVETNYLSRIFALLPEYPAAVTMHG